MYKGESESSFAYAVGLYEALPSYLGRKARPVIVVRCMCPCVCVFVYYLCVMVTTTTKTKTQKKMVHVHNLEISNKGSAENSPRPPPVHDLLEKAKGWADENDISFMEWGSEKKAERQVLERMRRAIMQEEEFYEKGMSIKRAH